MLGIEQSLAHCISLEGKEGTNKKDNKGCQDRVRSTGAALFLKGQGLKAVGALIEINSNRDISQKYELVPYSALSKHGMVPQSLHTCNRKETTGCVLTMK